MLELKSLSKTYRKREREVPALKTVDLSIQTGEFVSIEGPSGCGKSTMLLTAGLLQKPDEGTVTLSGTDGYSLDRAARAAFRREHIGFVFQQFHLIPYLSLEQNIRLPDVVEAEVGGEERALELIERLGLIDRLDHHPGELSVGERQRVALARALYASPTLILADEPTGNLDDLSAEKVLEGLKSFVKGGGIVMLVTHDARAAQEASTRYRMESGELLGAV